VVAHKKLDISGAIVVEQTLFPFQIDTVAAKTSELRAGWFLQQLIKFYAPLLISDMLENVLVIDADTVFYRRVKFIDNGKFLMDKTTEPQSAYYEHMARLHPTFMAWKKRTSGITNYMMFNKKILIEIMTKVEAHHKKEFWEAFLDTITEKTGSGASEYEIYFHYIMNNYPELVKHRPLRWDNYGQRAVQNRGDWECVSYHWQIQKPASKKLTTTR
jgi:hypothetical protein